MQIFAVPGFSFTPFIKQGTLTFVPAINHHFQGLVAQFIWFSGVVTAIGGGIIRDVLSGTIPVVLKSDFYATAALFGGILYLLLARFDFSVFTIFLCVACFVTTLRLLAYRYKVQLPKSRVNLRK